MIEMNVKKHENIVWWSWCDLYYKLVFLTLLWDSVSFSVYMIISENIILQLFEQTKCKFMCVYIYIYIHIFFIFLYTNTNINTNANTNIQIYRNKYIYIFIFIYIYTYVYIYI